MGASGCGKTTLLHSLAGINLNLQKEGEIEINGTELSKFKQKSLISYLRQDIIMIPYLTVRETLLFAAKLRLNSNIPAAKKLEIVEETILELGLSSCANSFIGNEWRSGISGGEKRRVALAIQLLQNPSILFCDEPTTGLDSFTSLALIQTLVALAKKGKTICISIHQPSSTIFELFDEILLLSKGEQIFFGTPDQSVKHFTNLNISFPSEANPADWLLDISTDNIQEENLIDRNLNFSKIWKNEGLKINSTSEIDEDNDSTLLNGEGLLENYFAFDGILKDNFLANKAEKTNLTIEEEENYSKNNNRASLIYQISTLTGRSVKIMFRDPLMFFGSVFEVIFFSVCVGLIFFQMPEDLAGIYSRKSILYLISSLQPYLFLIYMIYKLSEEIKVFDREREDNMYTVLAYFVSSFIANFPLQLLTCLLYSLILYFMTGLRFEGDLMQKIWNLGVFTAVNGALQLISTSFAYFTIAIFRDFTTASLFANFFYTFFALSSGFFVPYQIMPFFLSWIKDVSQVSFAYRILMSNEFENRIFECPGLLPEGSTQTIPQCIGNTSILQNGFNLNENFKNFIGLLGNFIFFTITTELKDVTIKIEKKGFTKTILDNVSVSFPAGKLSVILGPSGAGKSTLLKVLTNQPLNIPNLSKLTKTGETYFNDEIINDLSSVCSYVCQDDSHLIPSLTARETLRFAAFLRLPKNLTKEEKILRAEEILSLLDLNDCANVRVGSDIVKGLSGGEKRRLSIGIQMINDPLILVIDEPTSGLDSSTAKNLMMQLKVIAETGRTVICSIHQPRPDVFHHFDKVLLLSYGRVLFSGSNLNSYLHGIGFSIPSDNNTADYALSLSIIDHRNEESTLIFQKLVSKWKELGVHFEKALVPDSITNIEQEKNSNESHRKLQQQPKQLNSLIERIKLQQQKINFFNVLSILIKRSWINLKRQKNLFFARVFQIAVFGHCVVLLTFFQKLQFGQPFIQSRIGLLQHLSCGVIAGMVNCIISFPQLLNSFKFERTEKVYTSTAFLLSYSFIEIPFEILASLALNSVAFFYIGLRFSPLNFLLATISIFCSYNAGESIGIACFAIFGHVGFSIQVTSAFLSISTMLTGFLSVDNSLLLFDKISYLTPIRYVARILAINEFTDLEFTCTKREIAESTCFFNNGNVILELYKMDNLWFNFWVLILVTFLYRLIAFVVLTLKK
ncbi:hypothetical protein HDU92_002060 [Lobulomyces angularis]|nr:hypothetical protein HDU92_002060 [Lobulomyces angularis]